MALEARTIVRSYAGAVGAACWILKCSLRSQQAMPGLKSARQNAQARLRVLVSWCTD